MSKENVTVYSPIPPNDVQDSVKGGAMVPVDYSNPEPHNYMRRRQFRRFYFTCRDCMIVLVVVGIAIAAIVMSLMFGLPALEEKQALMIKDGRAPQVDPGLLALDVAAQGGGGVAGEFNNWTLTA